jgi:hypothetical protein
MDYFFKMKKKFQITFTVDCNYPYIEKETKKLAKAFDQWLKDWSSSESSGQDIIPILYTPGDEHQANGTVRVKITRDKEVILDTWWDALSPDF